MSKYNFSIGHINLSNGFRGGERQTELLIIHLAKLGVIQKLLCRKGSPLALHLKNTENLSIIELTKFIDFRLNGHKELSSCDIIQAHEARAAQWAYLHHLIYKTPYIIVRRVTEKIRKNFFNKRIYSCASEIVAISTSVKKNINQNFFISSRLTPDFCAHLVKNNDTVRLLKQKFSDRFVVGHIGALVDAHKGQSTLINAARILKNHIPNLLVLFIGDGPDRQKLEFLSKDISENVSFIGFVENIADYINVMDVFAFPSNYEGLGSTLLDVMEAGVPSVASNVDGIPDIARHMNNSLLIEKGNFHQLAEAIIRLKENEELRKQIVAEGRKTAETHSPESIAKKYLSLYKSILQ